MKRMNLFSLSMAGLLMTSPAVFAAEHVVKMLNMGSDGMMVYEPAFLKINKGDTVNFQATDPGHDAVSEVTPSGDNWRVGFEGGKVTFHDEGVHLYYCTPHKSLGMYGVIQVGEAKNKQDISERGKEIAAATPLNGDRITRYIEQAN